LRVRTVCGGREGGREGGKEGGSEDELEGEAISCLNHTHLAVATLLVLLLLLSLPPALVLPLEQMLVRDELEDDELQIHRQEEESRHPGDEEDVGLAEFVGVSEEEGWGGRGGSGCIGLLIDPLGIESMAFCPSIRLLPSCLPCLFPHCLFPPSLPHPMGVGMTRARQAKNKRERLATPAMLLKRCSLWMIPPTKKHEPVISNKFERMEPRREA
jgi:hypothetical protein